MKGSVRSFPSTLALLVSLSAGVALLAQDGPPPLPPVPASTNVRPRSAAIARTNTTPQMVRPPTTAVRPPVRPPAIPMTNLATTRVMTSAPISRVRSAVPYDPSGARVIPGRPPLVRAGTNLPSSRSAVPYFPAQGPTPVPLPAPQSAQSTALGWDALTKEYIAKPGENSAHVVYSVTNISSAQVVINSVRTSCGCTVAQLPSMPWRIAPQESGKINVTVDIRGKRGMLSKVVSVDSSVGMILLNVRVNIPEAEDDDRTRNMQIALADRQAVFRNDCATCHATPAVGKKGEDLFKAACGICHEAEHRGTMVPDLASKAILSNPEYWRTWITKGKASSLMPAFSREEGGPLSAEQIDSLVEFLSHRFPNPTAASK